MEIDRELTDRDQEWNLANEYAANPPLSNPIRQTWMSRPEEYVRCIKCQALISADAFECPECILLDEHKGYPDAGEETYSDLLTKDGPSNPVLRFFWGLGITLDVWILTLLTIVWFFVLCFAKSLLFAIVWTVIGFVIPLLLLLMAGPLSGLTISFVLATMQEIDPVAMKVFVWVYVLVAQGWLIYQLTI